MQEMNSSSNWRQNAHAVIIGINEYQDQKIPNLTFARADAEGVYQILTDPELGRIPPDNVILLLDEEATQRNICSAIGTKIPKRASEQDMVYIYFAGHGSPVMDSKSRSRDGMEKYLVPADAELDDLRATGISMDEIQRFFGWIESKQVMFFIDSCYSGEAGGRTFQNPQYKGRHLLSAEFLEDLASEGRLVVTACDVNEVSLETPDIGHGLFTHYLIEGLKGVADKDQDGLVTIHELYDYVYEQVSQHARKLGGSMHPIQKGSVKGKIFLTQYETAAQKQAKQLHAQAQSLYDTGKFDDAYELWQNVIKLVPDHDGAKRGEADIEDRRAEKKRQEVVEYKQSILLNLYHEGRLPSDEFEQGMALIEKRQDNLTVIESKFRKLLDDLTDEKISVAIYLNSSRLLKKPATDEKKTALAKSEPTIETKEPTPLKTEPQKIVKVKKTTQKPKPKVLKTEPPVPKIEPKKVSKTVVVLRKTLTMLSGEQVMAMLAEKNFYDGRRNEDGKGITHNYVEQSLNGNKMVIDKTTGLMWQQSGSSETMTYDKAENYIRDLNHQSFARFADWRLPTLEEAMSLMEPQEKNGDLYINPVFGKNQRYIWTADKASDSTAWVVYFNYGYCGQLGVGNDDYVRAVRVGQ